MKILNKTGADFPVCIAVSEASLPDPLHKGYDPEMVYVECSRCGSPVIWERGKTRELFKAAGVDPLELDPTCVLVTDGCPVCSGQGRFGVQIMRVTRAASQDMPITQGNA